MKKHIQPLMLNARDVAATIGVSKTLLYRMIREGSFPLGRKLSQARVAWPRATVEQWCAARPEAVDPVRIVVRDPAKPITKSVKKTKKHPMIRSKAILTAPPGTVLTERCSPGLRLVIGKTRKTWIYRYREDGRTKQVILGYYPPNTGPTRHAEGYLYPVAARCVYAATVAKLKTEAPRRGRAAR